jgi:cation diffusion facilitator family transporter
MGHSHSHGAEKTKVALISLLASGGLAAIKFLAAVFSGSLGLLSEAFHSLLDFGATALTLMAVRVSDKPADDDHHYGHAKMESLVALVEAGMLVGVSIWVAYEALNRLIFGGHEVALSPWLFAIIIVSIAVDLNRSRQLKATADKTGSAALAADALHFMADMWSSIAVLIGLAFVWLGFPWADALSALVVSAFIFRAAWNLGRETINNLLDAAPAGASESIRTEALSMNGVLDVRQLRLRNIGPNLHADLIVDVPRTLPVSVLDAMRHDIAERIAKKHANADCSIQLNPVELDTETAFDKVALIAEKHQLQVHHLAVQKIADRLAVSFDVEMDASLSLADAHDRATQLENDIREGLGADVEVESHIEPKEPRLLEGAAPAPSMVKKIEAGLAGLARKEKLLSDLHNIRIRSNDAGLFVHYHCRFKPDVTIAKVHEATDRIEFSLMDAFPNVRRIVAHAEPIGLGKHRL